MRILFDECVPVALKRRRFPLGQECQTVREARFAGKKNGELLTLAERRWDVLPTTDRKIQYQQDVMGQKIGIVVLRARTNPLQDLLPILPTCAQAFLSIRPGQEVAMS
jgi:predicted nuclease of predicted toxin-antitoxin system